MGETSAVQAGRQGSWLGGGRQTQEGETQAIANDNRKNLPATGLVEMQYTVSIVASSEFEMLFLLLEHTSLP